MQDTYRRIPIDMRADKASHAVPISEMIDFLSDTIAQFQFDMDPVLNSFATYELLGRMTGVRDSLLLDRWQRGLDVPELVTQRIIAKAYSFVHNAVEEAIPGGRIVELLHGNRSFRTSDGSIFEDVTLADMFRFFPEDVESQLLRDAT